MTRKHIPYVKSIFIIRPDQTLDSLRAIGRGNVRNPVDPSSLRVIWRGKANCPSSDLTKFEEDMGRRMFCTPNCCCGGFCFGCGLGASCPLLTLGKAALWPWNLDLDLKLRLGWTSNFWDCSCLWRFCLDILACSSSLCCFCKANCFCFCSALCLWMSSCCLFWCSSCSCCWSLCSR